MAPDPGRRPPADIRPYRLVDVAHGGDAAHDPVRSFPDWPASAEAPRLPGNPATKGGTDGRHSEDRGGCLIWCTSSAYSPLGRRRNGGSIRCGERPGRTCGARRMPGHAGGRWSLLSRKRSAGSPLDAARASVPAPLADPAPVQLRPGRRGRDGATTFAGTTSYNGHPCSFRNSSTALTCSISSRSRVARASLTIGTISWRVRGYLTSGC